MFKFLKRLLWGEHFEDSTPEDANAILIEAINAISENGFKLVYRNMEVAGLCDPSNKTIYINPERTQDLNVFCSIIVHEATHILDYLKPIKSTKINDLVEQALESEDNAHSRQERFLKNSYYDNIFAANMKLPGTRLRYFTHTDNFQGSREWYRDAIRSTVEQTRENTEDEI